MERVLLVDDFFNSKSDKFKGAVFFVKKIARTDVTVLITGESGTGKSLLAKVIHEGSNRKSGPFYTINCAAIQDQLLESELFGHTKGSFTGAVSDKIGKVQMADGGTIFLDEIGETSLKFQTSILRFIQERVFERVGGTTQQKADVRIIAATNQPLMELVRVKKFREDLFYRLNVARVSIPPIRERKEDIIDLATSFVEEFKNTHQKNGLTIRPDFFDSVCTYDWPGNIREMRNAIERALIIAEDIVDSTHLPEEINLTVSSIDSFNKSVEKNTISRFFDNLSLKELERVYIEHVLKTSKDFSAAAKTLGIDQSTLWRKRKSYMTESNLYKC